MSIWDTPEDAEPQFGSLNVGPLKHMFTNNKLMFICKLFTNIYLHQPL